MPRNLIPILCLGVVLADAGPAGARALPEPPAIPAQLTLDRALELVRTRSFDLAIAHEAARSAAGDAIVAGALPNPVFSFSVGRSFLCQGSQCDGAAGLAWVAAVSDQGLLESTLSGKRALRRRVADAAWGAARLGAADARRTIEFQVKQQFLQLLLAQEAARFAAEVRASNDRTYDLSARRLSVGAISTADLTKVEVAALESDQAVDAAQQAVRAARIALAQLLGVRGPVPEFAAVAPELLRGAALPRLAAISPAALLREAEARRPDLKAAALGAARADAALALARRQRFPDVALGLQYAQEGSGAGAITPPTISLALSAPLPLFYRQRGEIAKAEADTRTQALQRAKLAAQVSADVAAARSAWLASSSQLARMEGRLLERARRSRDLAQVQFQQGAASLLELLDAQRTYIAVNLEHLQTLQAYWTAVFQLEQAVDLELRR